MISFIIPLFNEEKSLEPLYEEVKHVVQQLKKPYEIIFVDDGSTDGSLDILQSLAKKDKNIRIFSFRKNQGKAEVLMVGFQKAQGDIIVTLDADLEDKPAEVPGMIQKLDEGYDVVSGWRKNRKHAWYMVGPSKFFNFLVSSLWGLKLHDYNCGLKVYRKEAVKSIRIYGGLHRFIPLFVHQHGFRVTELPVFHEKRKYGKSKYGFSKIFKDIPDLFTMFFLTKYGQRPLHFFGMIGSAFLFAGFIILFYLSVLRFQGETIGDRPLLLFGILFVLSGLQIFFTGFLADLFLNISRNDEVDQQWDNKLKFSTG